MMFAFNVSWRTSPVYPGMYADIRREGRGGKYSGIISKASDIAYEYAVQCFVSIILGLSVSDMNFGMVTRFKLRDSNPKVDLEEKQEEFRSRDMRKDATKKSWRYQSNEGYII